MTEIRLQKFLADAGVASRRVAEGYIAAGRVTVDGKVVTEMGTKVGLGQKVALDGEAIKPRADRVIYAFNKPRGVFSTMSDEYASKTIADFFPSSIRVYPVGRLDKDSEGLMLVTNDGALAHELMHPKHEHEKEYRVELAGQGKPVENFEKRYRLTTGQVQPMKVSGVRELGNHHKVVNIVLKEGKKRQIREVAKLLGYKVTKLQRIRIGKLLLGSLPPGKWKKVDRGDILG